MFMKFWWTFNGIYYNFTFPLIQLVIISREITNIPSLHEKLNFIAKSQNHMQYSNTTSGYCPNKANNLNNFPLTFLSKKSSSYKPWILFVNKVEESGNLFFFSQHGNIRVHTGVKSLLLSQVHFLTCTVLSSGQVCFHSHSVHKVWISQLWWKNR